MPCAFAVPAKPFATPGPLIQNVTKAAEIGGGALHDCLPDGRKPGTVSTTAIELVSVTKVFGVEMAVTVLDDVSLAIRHNQSFIHPERPGCGKTTGLYQTAGSDMSDRIAVLQAGSIEQPGTPDEIDERPVNTFVADCVYMVEFEESPDLTVHEQNVTGRAENLRPGDSPFLGIAPGAPRMLPD